MAKKRRYMTVAQRRNSDRMKRENPMHDRETVEKARKTKEETGYRQLMSKVMKGRWERGEVPSSTPSLAARKKASGRMTKHNPMYDPKIVEKVRVTQKARGHHEAFGRRVRAKWAVGEMPINRPQGHINKHEAKTLAAIKHLGFRYTGDSQFWLAKTNSGIRRNPDFIWRSGSDKAALLLHGSTWHRDQKKAEIEAQDYVDAGWNILILWTDGRYTKAMLEQIVTVVEKWCNGLQSNRSAMPAMQQFTISKSARIIRSLPKA